MSGNGRIWRVVRVARRISDYTFDNLPLSQLISSLTGCSAGSKISKIFCECHLHSARVIDFGGGGTGQVLMSARLIPPESFETILRQRSITRGVLDVSVSEVSLERAGIVAVIRQLIATGVAKHVSVGFDS
jgi:hypothetical protein